jgi:hypothetical protein
MTGMDIDVMELSQRELPFLEISNPILGLALESWKSSFFSPSPHCPCTYIYIFSASLPSTMAKAGTNIPVPTDLLPAFSLAEPARRQPQSVSLLICPHLLSH